MKATAVFPKERQLRVVDHPEPRLLAPTQVVLRILEVGLCGTDREIASFQYGTPPDDSPYLVMGHEALAEVVEVGTSVRRLSPGDLVVPTVRRPCRDVDCRACAMGRPDFCLTGKYTQRGIRGAHGYLAEQVVDEMRYLHHVPRELRDVAVLAQPLGIAEQAIAQLEDVQRRLPWTHMPPDSGGLTWESQAVVLGAGPVGVLGALALVVRGWHVTVFSREARGEKSRLVESFGIGYATEKDETIADLAHRLGNVDVIFEATGASPIAYEAMQSLGANGVFIFTGIPGRKSPVPRELSKLMQGMVMKNQVLFGTVNPGGDAYRAAVQDLALFSRRWPQVLPKLVTDRRPLEESPDLLRSPARGIKEVVAIDEVGS